jgi:transcriptional regulator with XRE-family HTH domain
MSSCLEQQKTKVYSREVCEKMIFAQQIRAYRIAAGLTQAELAAKIGYSQQTVNNWETQRVEPWPRKKDTILDQVMKATGCGRFSELVTSRPPPPVQERAFTLRRPTRGEKKSGIQKRTRPNVCEEITGESSSNPGSQKSVAHPKAIDFRRPPARG